MICCFNLCDRREKFCDFCNCELPDWKSVLTPSLGNTAPAVMNVNFDNKTYSFHVAPGGWIIRVIVDYHWPYADETCFRPYGTADLWHQVVGWVHHAYHVLMRCGHAGTEVA